MKDVVTRGSGKKPTIKDVATHAGLSKSTVSLVLQKSELIKQETRERVEASISTLGYVRNRAAASLRGSGSGLIGLVINDLRNPFFTEFAASAQMRFMEADYACVIANTDEDPAVQRQVMASMLEHEVAGLLWCPAMGDNEDSFALLSRFDVPVLQVLRQPKTRYRPLPFFSLDYGHGSKLAAEHLIAQGVRKIAFVGGVEGASITAERMQGYLSGVRRGAIDSDVFYGRASRDFGYNMGTYFCEHRPDIEAAVCFNDLVALGLMSSLAQCGRQIGRDFRIVGFDDITECAQVFPQLSSVNCDIAAFGRESANVVLRALSENTSPLAPSVMPVHLEVRSSSG